MGGLRFLLVLFFALMVAEMAKSEDSAKSIPKPKPPKPPRPSCPNGCGFGAVCQAGKCVCRSRRAGDPNFVCYTPRFYYLCQIASDPMLTTTDKQVAGIKMPASLAFTQLVTRRFGKGRGMCGFKMNGWTERFDGKYFIKALEFQITQTPKGSKPIESKFRVVAKADKNNYYFSIFERTTKGWAKIAEIKPKSKRSFVKDLSGCSLRFLKLGSNFLYINIVCCNIRMAIRPYNEDKPKAIPGVWLMVRQWAKMNTLPNGLCNNGTNGPKIDALKDEYGFESRTQYTTYMGLAYGRPLTYPGAFAGLAALQNTMQNCKKNKAGKFMTKSEFLFNFAKLIACEKDKIMDITYKVVKGFCNDDKKACDAAITALKTDCPDVKPNKQMKAFLENGCQ